MRGAKDWHFYRQETADKRNQLLVVVEVSLAQTEDMFVNQGTICMLFHLASSHSGDPAHRSPNDAPTDGLPSCWQRLSARTHYTCWCRTNKAIMENHICRPSAGHRAASSVCGEQAREIGLLFLFLSSSGTSSIQQSL